MLHMIPSHHQNLLGTFSYDIIVLGIMAKYISFLVRFSQKLYISDKFFKKTIIFEYIDVVFVHILGNYSFLSYN